MPRRHALAAGDVAPVCHQPLLRDPTVEVELTCGRPAAAVWDWHEDYPAEPPLPLCERHDAEFLDWCRREGRTVREC